MLSMVSLKGLDHANVVKFNSMNSSFVHIEKFTGFFCCCYCSVGGAADSIIRNGGCNDICLFSHEACPLSQVVVIISEGIKVVLRSMLFLCSVIVFPWSAITLACSSVKLLDISSLSENEVLVLDRKLFDAKWTKLYAVAKYGVWLLLVEERLMLIKLSTIAVDCATILVSKVAEGTSKWKSCCGLLLSNLHCIIQKL